MYLILCFFQLLSLQCTELECWSFGVLEYWIIGVFECWSLGVQGERTANGRRWPSHPRFMSLINTDWDCTILHWITLHCTILH